MTYQKEKVTKKKKRKEYQNLELKMKKNNFLLKKFFIKKEEHGKCKQKDQKQRCDKFNKNEDLS